VKEELIQIGGSGDWACMAWEECEAEMWINSWTECGS